MKYDFETIKEAEDYYYGHLAVNNDDEAGLENWLEGMSIKECAEEDMQVELRTLLKKYIPITDEEDKSIISDLVEKIMSITNK